MENEISFNDKFNALAEYYNIESLEEIRNQIAENENIFILLEEVKPFLEESFGDADYSLEMNFEPEIDDDYVILRLNVSEERFNNGVSDDIRALDFKIWDLRREIQIFRELSIMPGIKDV